MDKPRYKRKKPKYYYMLVTKDEFELPIAVAESVVELAKIIGVKANSIYSLLSRNEGMWRKIAMEDDNDE